MRLPSDDFITQRRCSCPKGCWKCHLQRYDRNEKKAKQEIQEWEEAEVIPTLYNLFAENKFLNVVFDWSPDGNVEEKVIVIRPKMDFMVVNVSETSEAWPLTEEVKPLSVIQRYENCDEVYHKSTKRNKVKISLPPEISVRHSSLSFAFETEVTFEIAAEFQSVNSVNFDNVEPVVNRRIRVTATEVREEFNVRTKNRKHPKYFCKSCSKEICKDCLQSRCNSHNVHWLGNQNFNCDSSSHRLSSCF